MLAQTVFRLVDLPRQLGAAVEEAVRSAAELSGSVSRMERLLGEVTELLSSAGKDIRELRETSERQDEYVARVEAVAAEIGERLASIETLVTQLARDVDEATDRLPTKDRGPMDKAREALTR